MPTPLISFTIVWLIGIWLASRIAVSSVALGVAAFVAVVGVVLIWRLVHKTLSHSKKEYFLRQQIALEDAIYNFVRPDSALRVKLAQSAAHERKWELRTPAMTAGLTDYILSFLFDLATPEMLYGQRGTTSSL